MRKLRVLRDVGLIFSLAFTMTIVFTLIMGVEYTSSMVASALTLSSLYAIMSLLFFWKWLIRKVGYIPIEIFYVIMLNVIYIIAAQFENWEFTTRGYILNAIFSVIAYIIVKLIIFSIDYAEAKRVNEILKKRKEGENH